MRSGYYEEQAFNEANNRVYFGFLYIFLGVSLDEINEDENLKELKDLDMLQLKDGYSDYYCLSKLGDAFFHQYIKKISEEFIGFAKYCPQNRINEKDGFFGLMKIMI